jgi:hypothetical protein
MYKKLAFAAASLLVSSAAFSGDNMMYKDLDTDRDGKISAQEATASPQLTNQWMRLDTNADGMVDQAEFAKMEVREMEQEREYKPMLSE